MSRKNCRMTDEERANHDRAVSVRKMTDEQLCTFLDRQHGLGMEEGMRIAKEQNAGAKDEATVIDRFITFLETKKGTGNGIGGGTLYRLRREAEMFSANGAQ